MEGDINGIQSEYALENEMMNQLEQLGYERVTIRDNKQLLDNFRTILNKTCHGTN